MKIPSISPLKKSARILLGAGLCLALGYVPGYAATVWDSATALYAFDNNLDDSNGLNNGIGRKGSDANPVAPIFEEVVVPEDVPGWTGTALRLASDRYVYLGQGNDNDFQITGSLTLFARVYIQTARPNIGLISKQGASGEHAYGLNLTNISGSGGTISGRLYPESGGSIIDVSYTSSDITTYKWMDVALVYEAGSRIEVYLNGVSVVLVEDDVPSSLFNTDVTPLLFGAQAFPTANGYSAYMTGLFERAAIWDRALTTNEVRSLSLPPIPEPQAVAGVMASFMLAFVLYRKKRRSI